MTKINHILFTLIFVCLVIGTSETNAMQDLKKGLTLLRANLGELKTKMTTLRDKLDILREKVAAHSPLKVKLFFSYEVNLQPILKYIDELTLDQDETEESFKNKIFTALKAKRPQGDEFNEIDNLKKMDIFKLNGMLHFEQDLLTNINKYVSKIDCISTNCYRVSLAFTPINIKNPHSKPESISYESNDTVANLADKIANKKYIFPKERVLIKNDEGQPVAPKTFIRDLDGNKISYEIKPLEIITLTLKGDKNSELKIAASTWDTINWLRYRISNIARIDYVEQRDEYDKIKIEFNNTPFTACSDDLATRGIVDNSIITILYPQIDLSKVVVKTWGEFINEEEKTTKSIKEHVKKECNFEDQGNFIEEIVTDTITACLLATILATKKTGTISGQNPQEDSVLESVAKDTIQNLICTNKDKFKKFEAYTSQKDYYTDRIKFILNTAVELLVNSKTNDFLKMILLKQDLNLNKDDCINQIAGHLHFDIEGERGDKAIDKLSEVLYGLFESYILYSEQQQKKSFDNAQKKHTFHNSWIKDIYLKTPILR